MKKKYVQAMMACMAAALTVTVPVTTVSAAVPEKEQTVYVTADQNGNKQQVIVSNWLKNGENEASLTDKSELTDIQNVKGDETFTKDSNGNITWDAQGNDIYYQGTTSEELPVAVKITYYLDGKEMQPSELAGKSGKVKIRIDYENKAEKTVEIDGKEEKIHVPFMMATGMILPADTFSNVEVKNGKVISDGQNDIVMGIGFPGLADSLQLSDIEGMKDTEIPDYVEITADVEDFSLALTATVATTGTLNELGLDEIDSLDDLKDSMKELTDASTALVEGSQELKEGIETLDSSANEFVDGLNSADEGTGKLKNGIDTMNNSKGELLDGISQLVAGMQALGSGAGELQAGVKSYTDGTSQLDAGITQVNDGAGQLKAGIDTLNDKKADLIAGVDRLSEGSTQVKAGAVNLKNNLLTYTSGVAALSDGIDSLDKQLQESIGLLADLPTKMNALKGNLDTMAGDAGQFQAGDQTVSDAAGTIKTQMNTQMNTLGNAINSAETQVNAVADSMGTVVSDVNSAAVAQAKTYADSVKSQVDANNEAQTQAVTDAVNNIEGLTEEQRNTILNAVKDALQSHQTTVNTYVTIDVTEEMKAVQNRISAAGQTLQGISGQLANVQVDTQALTQLSDGAQAAAAGAGTLQTEMSALSSKVAGMTDVTSMFAALMEGVGTLNAKSSELCGYNAALVEGAGKLADGASQVDAGINGETGLKAGAAALGAGVSQLADGANTLVGGTQQLKVGADTLIANNSKLSDGTAKLVSGSSALIVGGKALQSGGVTLSNGILQLADGASQLKEGTSKLAAGGKELKEGTTKLLDGSTELADGMKEFDEEGIQKLSDTLEGDLQRVLDRLDAVVDADKTYTAFDGWDKDADGSVKFIIETAAIEK